MPERTETGPRDEGLSYGTNMASQPSSFRLPKLLSIPILPTVWRSFLSLQDFKVFSALTRLLSILLVAIWVCACAIELHLNTDLFAYLALGVGFITAIVFTGWFLVFLCLTSIAVVGFMSAFLTLCDLSPDSC